MIAQRLYESGFITYMRTDSVNLSEYATASSKDAIIQMMGERYIHPRHFETKTKGAQEAHHRITNGGCGTGKDYCYHLYKQKR